MNCGIATCLNRAIGTAGLDLAAAGLEVWQTLYALQKNWENDDHSLDDLLRIGRHTFQVHDVADHAENE